MSTDTSLSEVDLVKSFIARCDAQIAKYRADAAAESRPELAQVSREIADIWRWQRADLERRLAQLEERS